MEKRDLLTSLGIIGGGIALDQLTKFLVVQNFSVHESVKLIGEFFRLTYVQNTGAAFSIFEGNMVLFLIISILGFVGFSYLLKKTSLKKNKFELISLSMMIGGLFGNLIDRLRLHYVVDMLDFNIFGWDFPVFNVADILLCVGTLIYVLCILKEDK